MEKTIDMAIDKEVLNQLLAGCDPYDLFARDGLLDELKKTLSERMLSAELDVHSESESAAGTINRRNGSSRKTMLTGISKVTLDVPRAVRFQAHAKYQRRLPDFDDKIISMYAGGMTVREIRGHLTELYGIDVSPDLISRVTDAVLEAVVGWQVRPLDTRYPLVFFAIRMKIRDEGFVWNKAVYIALDIQPDGTKEMLGIWIDQTEDAEFWLRVMNELKNRGVADILNAVVDGLKGRPEAINAVFPEAIVQTCIVHLIGNSISFASRKVRKFITEALRGVYRAETPEAGMAALEVFETAVAQSISAGDQLGMLPGGGLYGFADAYQRRLERNRRREDGHPARLNALAMRACVVDLPAALVIPGLWDGRAGDASGLFGRTTKRSGMKSSDGM